jgi:hypothetical protein
MAGPSRRGIREIAREIGEGDSSLAVADEIAFAAIDKDLAAFGSEEVDEDGFDLAPSCTRELHLRISSVEEGRAWRGTRPEPGQNLPWPLQRLQFDSYEKLD